ncbi:MAG: endonuclease V, partial [Candidatus Jordarchaeaceae archaeon]
ISLSRRVVCEDKLPKKINYVGGVDATYTNKYAIGAVVVLEYDTLKIVEKRISYQIIDTPYIPTFLSFREILPINSAINMLSKRPDAYLVDGHGIAHPRHLGFASHLGIVIDSATIGVAKKLLCGEVLDTKIEDWNPIVYKGKIVGAALYPKQGSKRIYVSIGNKVSLERSIEIVKHCVRNHRIPEPLLEAHKTALETRRVFN